MDAVQFKDLKNRVDDIHAALIGNPITNDGGMVKEMRDIKSQVGDLQKFKDRSKWTASLLIGFAGMLGWVSDKIIDFFSKH